MSSELKYNIFGSEDSTDVDAIVFVDDMPPLIEDRKRLATKIGKEFGERWNVIVARVADGVIADCTYPKASPDSLNNALLATYKYHDQEFACMVTRRLERNKILAIYKTVRIISTYLTRTQYRTLIRPTMNWRNDFRVKLEKLLLVDFDSIKTFNQANVSDLDIWKTYAFYLWQNIALVWDGGPPDSNRELYTKQQVLNYGGPLLEPYLYRREIATRDVFDANLKWWVGKLLEMPIVTKGMFIHLDGERADMETEMPA